MQIHLTPIRMTVIKKMMNVDEDVDQTEPDTLLVKI